MSPSVRAADGDSPWSVRVWKAVDGLGGDNIGGVTETPDGFLWIVAGGRLSRFDGTRIETFALSRYVEGLEGKIRTLRSLDQHGLGLLMVDGSIVRTAASRTDVFATELPPSRADALIEDEAGGLLISYSDGSVYRLFEGRLTALTERDGLPASRSRCVFTTDHRGRVWFAKGGHIGIFHAGRFQALTQIDDSTPRLAAARDGGLWIASHLQLLKFHPERPLQKMGVIPVATSTARPTAVLEDRRGAVWIGTTTSGLLRFDGSRFENVPVSHREVSNLTEDREGNIWVGTGGGGLNQVQPRTLRIEGEEVGLPFQTVQALCEDPHGLLWAVTQDGSLVSRANGKWQNVFSDGDRFRAEGSCIAADATGAIWIGTLNQRLYRWHEGTLTTWSEEDGFLSPATRTVFVDRGGDLWIGGAKPASLQRLRAGRIENFPVPEQSHSIWAITQDAAGDIWAGGTGGCLLRIGADDRVVDESALIPSPPNSIRHLHATPDGALWVSLDQGGVGRIKGNTFSRITTKEGMIDDNLRLAISDNRGWLWFAAIPAVFKVRQSELDAVAEGRAERVQPVQYGSEHGLHAVLGGTVGALLSRDGRLWLPLATSLVVIDPASQQHRTEPPPVLITRVAVDEQVLGSYGGALPAAEGVEISAINLRLAPDHRRLDLDFTALSLSTPKNIRFQYRLENFDDRWRDAGRDRRATYSRLTAGDYRFRVRACNSDGVWNETGATLAFTVDPFLRDTWWFRSAVLALFTSAVFGTTRYASLRRLRQKVQKLERETAVERERARIARDIHDDLGSRLTKIVLLSGVMSRERTSQEKNSERAQEISETARQLMKSLDETVWAVNPRNDNLPHLINYLCEFAVKFLRTAEIACVLDVPEDPPLLPVSADVRHNLYLATKEALTNVVRHAQATEVRLQIVATSALLQIVVEDNGRGFSHEAAGINSDGLYNMRQRLTQIGGKFDIASAPGRGTRVTLQLGLGRRK